MKTRRILLYVAYSIGIFLAAMCFTMMILMLFDPEVPGMLKKFMGFGAALGFGWVVLLLAAMFQPFKRRFVLIITLLTLVMTIFMSLIVHKQEPFQMWYYWFSMIVPGVVALFCLFVYIFSRPVGEEEEETTEEKAKEENQRPMMEDDY